MVRYDKPSISAHAHLKHMHRMRLKSKITNIKPNIEKQMFFRVIPSSLILIHLPIQALIV